MGDLTTKTCTTCHETKPLEQFQKRADQKDGRAYRCKACSTVYEKSRVKQRREYANGRYKNEPEYREKKKQRVKDRYAQGGTYTEATKKRARQWNIDNPERTNENYRRRYKAYYGPIERAAKKANPEYQRRKRLGRKAHAVKRRSLLANAGKFTVREWDALCAYYNHCCAACGAKAPLTIDHVIPLSRGGTNTIENLQPLCLPCNLSKFTKTTDYRILSQGVLDLD